MKQQCIVCGKKIGRGLPFANHMEMHERRGEAKRYYTRRGGMAQWLKVAPVGMGPLFEQIARGEDGSLER